MAQFRISLPVHQETVSSEYCSNKQFLVRFPIRLRFPGRARGVPFYASI